MAGMTEFVERRRPSWEELNAILLRVGKKGVRRLSREDLKAIGPLYRRAASDLAYVRLRGGDSGVAAYLNDLVTRAHGLLYADRGPGLERLWQFVSLGFPRLLYRRRMYVLAAFALFLFGGVLGAAFTLYDPTVGAIFLGPRAQETDFYKDLPKTLTDAQRPTDAALITTNNIKVAFYAFSLGILGGFPSLLVLFANGLPIGALAVLQHRAGYDAILWSFLLPHGIPELTAIFIAGAAGMMLGHAIIAPGELTRSDALKQANHDAIRLVLGTIGLFIIAGFIETFISPTALLPVYKFAFAALMAIAMAAYLRRGVPPRKPEAPRHA